MTHRRATKKLKIENTIETENRTPRCHTHIFNFEIPRDLDYKNDYTSMSTEQEDSKIRSEECKTNRGSRDGVNENSEIPFYRHSQDLNSSANPNEGNSTGNPSCSSNITSVTEEGASLPQQTREDGSVDLLVIKERQNFLIFIKILFKILKEAQTPTIHNKAQRVVIECKRRNRQKDPKFMPLIQALERRLRILVGEAIWRRAHLYLHHFLSSNDKNVLLKAVQITPV